MQAMQDPHPYVKDITAWTISRIFEFLHSPDIEPPIVTPESLPPIIAVLIKSLQDNSHIAYRVCCAISALAVGFQGRTGIDYSRISVLFSVNRDIRHDSLVIPYELSFVAMWYIQVSVSLIPPFHAVPLEGGTSPMSPFFKDTVAALLQCAQRHASHENAKVQISAFEAINDLVRSASRDTLDIVAQLIQVPLMGGDRERVYFSCLVIKDWIRGGQVWKFGELNGVNKA